MSISTSISNNELRRLAVRAYEGKTLWVRLCSQVTTTYDQNSPVSSWLSLELAQTQGYAPFSATIGSGQYDGPTGKYKLPSIDAPFNCTSGVITYNNVLVYIDDYVDGTETYTGTNVSFQTSLNTITRTSGTFVGLLESGSYVKVEGSGGNDGTYLVSSVAALTVTLDASTPLTITEGAGASVTLTKQTLYPYAIIEEIPNIALAEGQTQTYRVELSTDDA